MSARAVITENEIIGSLQRLGIFPDDCVMVHSSLSSFGLVDGGADAVIDAFLAVLGSGGTLVMPTLCQKDKERRFETWDLHRSPSDVGKITETFRLWPDVLRSDHATHSVAVLGPLAKEITQGHAAAGGRRGPWGDAAFACGSPWQKFYDLNARIVFVGVTFRVNTMGHFIEHLVAERALCRFSAERKAAMAGRLRGWNKPGVWPGFDRVRLQDELDSRGMLAWSQCGSAWLLMVESVPMVDYALQRLEAEPRAWFDADFCEWLKESEKCECHG